MKIERIAIEKLRPYKNNPRINSSAIESVAKSIQEFGFTNPILIDEIGEIIAGHTRLEASKKLGLSKVSCIRIKDLTEQQIKAYRLLDNKLAEKAEWDFEKLELELKGIDFDFNEFDIDWKLPEIELENESDYSDKNKEINLADIGDEFKMIFSFSEQDFFLVQESLNQQVTEFGISKESVIKKLLNV